MSWFLANEGLEDGGVAAEGRWAAPDGVARNPRRLVEQHRLDARAGGRMVPLLRDDGQGVGLDHGAEDA